MLIGENERLSLWLRCQGEGLTKPLKAQLIKQKNDEFVQIKFKDFCAINDISDKVSI